jgi:quercetin dioxygenase-like cupin family protein
MAAPKSKVIHYTDAPIDLLGETAPGASLRILVDHAQDGASTTELLMIELEPGGRSPHHSHIYEVSSFVVEGHGRVLIDATWHDLQPGDVIHVPGGVLHEFVNTEDTVFKFLCAVPAKRQPAI